VATADGSSGSGDGSSSGGGISGDVRRGDGSSGDWRLRAGDGSLVFSGDLAGSGSGDGSRLASGNGSSGIGETAVVAAAGADDPRVVPPRPLPTRVRGEWC
jgi:hypothetical protein